MLELVWNYRGFLQAAAVTGLLVIAFFRGAAPERWSAAILFAAIVALRLSELATGGIEGSWSVAGFATDDLAYFAIDFLTFAALLTIALRANRIYPLWMAGVQLTALMTHIAERTTDIVSPLAYAILNLSTFYLAIVFLAAGLAAHIRRSKTWGRYPSWLRDLRLSRVPTPGPLPSSSS